MSIEQILKEVNEINSILSDSIVLSTRDVQWNEGDTVYGFSCFNLTHNQDYRTEVVRLYTEEEKRRGYSHFKRRSIPNKEARFDTVFFKASISQTQYKTKDIAILEDVIVLARRVFEDGSLLPDYMSLNKEAVRTEE